MMMWQTRKRRGTTVEMHLTNAELAVLKRALGMLCNDEMEVVSRRADGKTTKRLDIASAMYHRIEEYTSHA